jgi:hypothetical protein
MILSLKCKIITANEIANVCGGGVLEQVTVSCEVKSIIQTQILRFYYTNISVQEKLNYFLLNLLQIPEGKCHFHLWV